MRRWLPLATLAAASFVMVLDSSVMNVAISQIAADLDTTISGVQLAITLYTLVMAAFMLVGAKLGDIWGRQRAFSIGLIVYGIGSLTTALSPNLPVLLLGWSLIEGLGAVLVIPAIAALVAANYEGKDRAFAYSMIGASTGVAIALGPLIGGWMTTTYSWRYVFVGEVVIVIVILIARGQMKAEPRIEHPPELDLVGAGLSALGLGLVVLGVLKSSTWGWLRPKGAPTIDGHEITPLGFSLVPYMILAGLGLLWAFFAWEARRERLGLDVILHRALLAIEHLRAGLSTLVGQQLVIMGIFFVLPVYLQVVLGLDAFETGKKLVPLSISMLLAALVGPRLSGRLAPRPVVQAGLGAMSLSALVLAATVDVELNERGFALAVSLFGIGAGLLMSQLGNVIMSSAPVENRNEAGGLQGTAQNLGASLGTALIGSVLLAGLLTGFTTRIAENPAIAPATVSRLEAATEQGIPIITTDDAHDVLIEAGVSPAEADAITADYGEAQVEALQKALFAAAILALASLMLTGGLPSRPLVHTEIEPAPTAGSVPLDG